jgi:hypothetical protein
MVQSTRSRQKQTEIPGRWTRSIGTLVIAFVVVLFCDLQPFVLDAMFSGSGGIAVVLANWLNTVAPVLALAGVVIAFPAI